MQAQVPLHLSDERLQQPTCGLDLALFWFQVAQVLYI